MLADAWELRDCRDTNRLSADRARCGFLWKRFPAWIPGANRGLTVVDVKVWRAQGLNASSGMAADLLYAGFLHRPVRQKRACGTCGTWPLLLKSRCLG